MVYYDPYITGWYNPIYIYIEQITKVLVTVHLDPGSPGTHCFTVHKLNEGKYMSFRTEV